MSPTLFLPGLEALMGEDNQANKLKLPDLNPDAVKLAIDDHCTREDVKMPYYYGATLKKEVQAVKEKLGSPR